MVKIVILIYYYNITLLLLNKYLEYIAYIVMILYYYK